MLAKVLIWILALAAVELLSPVIHEMIQGLGHETASMGDFMMLLKC